MIFHYVSTDGALMCEIRVKGLTQRVNGWTVYSRFKDSDYTPRPDEESYYYHIPYDPSEHYGGYNHFVAESISREAAQKIVTALGGYLVDDSYIPVGRQLHDGGPFLVHLFDKRSPFVVGEYPLISDALDNAHATAENWPVQYPVRVYDFSGCLMFEIIGEVTRQIATFVLRES